MQKRFLDFPKKINQMWIYSKRSLRVLPFLLLCSAGLCDNFSKFVSSEAVLTSFFGGLMEETSAGYAVYGEKPLYLGDFSQPEWTIPGTKRHKNLNQSYLSLRIIKALPRDLKTESYILINNGDDISKSHRFMIINRNAFKSVFEKNLPLFKYKLGWDVNFETLSKRFEALNHSSVNSVKYEPALQGITLGYGTDNAISWERYSTFMDAALSTTPQCPPKQLPPLPITEEEVSDRIESIFKSSDWEKVKEETKDFSNHYILNPEGNLKVFFAFHKDSEETKLLIDSYRNAQSILDQALSRQGFLNDILVKLGIDETSLSRELALPGKEFLSQSLAKSIKYTFSDSISTEFIAGLKEGISLNSGTSLDPNSEETLFLEVLAEKAFFSPLRKARNQEAHAFFQQIESVKGVSCLIPQKLYAHILKIGSEKKQVTPNTKSVLVNYLIRGVEGDLIGGTYKLEEPTKLNLEEIIPGLAHGLIGMKKGEVREIYTHPDFAYGVHSEFGNGSILQIKVELVSMGETSNDFNLPYLQPIDARMVAPIIKTCEDFKKVQKKYNYLCGLKTGLHYKKAVPLIDSDKVIELILSGDNTSPYTEQEREAVSLLNRVIYQASPEHVESDW